MRYEVGTLNSPGFIGFRTAVEQFKRTGPVSIEKRILALANRLMSQIRELKNVDVITPEGKAQSVWFLFGLGTSNPRRWWTGCTENTKSILRAVVTEPPAVRASIHYLNTEEEMDSIAEAVAAMATGGK